MPTILVTRSGSGRVARRMDSAGEPVLPSFTLSGVLPPYLPEVGPTANNGGRSPYRITPAQLVSALATSPERRSLLRSLFVYRQSLRDLGLAGYQWIDGSFVEDVEQTRGRPPGDIDLVTHVKRPLEFADPDAWEGFVNENEATLWREGAGLHCFIVDLALPPEVLVSQAVYWSSLFSHQRETALWKGFVQIDLAGDDETAIAMLEQEDAH